MVNKIFFELIYRTNGMDKRACKVFNCTREELKSTIEILKEYNEGFKLIKVTPWRINYDGSTNNESMA